MSAGAGAMIYFSYMDDVVLPTKAYSPGKDENKKKVQERSGGQVEIGSVPSTSLKYTISLLLIEKVETALHTLNYYSNL